MIGAQTELKLAEKLKEYILKNNLLDKNYSMKIKEGKIVFPVKKIFEMKDVDIIECNFKKKETRKNWREALQDKLTQEEFKTLKTAHDIVGSIAILEIPDELYDKEKIIAETLLKYNKNVKTVLRKAGEHSGIYRTQKMKWLAGEKTKETIHKETNVRMKLNVEEVFFSARLATERKRILRQIKKGEKVMVLFSGCSPYVCVFAKNTEALEVWGIELNPEGHKYAIENVKLNKLKNVNLIKGDVHKEVPKIKEKFDRVSMQLPKSAKDFLPEAFKLSKKGTIIHFYDFEHENEFDKTKQKVQEAAEKEGLRIKFLDFVKCGKFGPGKFRVCQDFKIVSLKKTKKNGLIP